VSASASFPAEHAKISSKGLMVTRHVATVKAFGVALRPPSVRKVCTIVTAMSPRASCVSPTFARKQASRTAGAQGDSS
jgi:hypothetical protein